MEKIIAIDKNIEVYNKQVEEWKKYNIDVIRVDTINSAINKLIKEEDFIFVAINEDSVPNFISQLHILRDVCHIPIFVITSNYTIDKEINALTNGADEYATFNSSLRKNVLVAIEILKSRNRWSKTKSFPVIVEGDIVLSPSRRDVFVKDIKITLSKKEFDILHYLMINKGRIVPYAQLIQKIWGDEYSEYDTNILWRTVDRLRSKLSVSKTNKHIKVERGVGYKFII